jgi:[ribosomal protein S18]-alanine N-acetyltransferase
MLMVREARLEDLDHLVDLDHEVFPALAYPGLVLRQFLDFAGPLLMVGCTKRGAMVAFSIVVPSSVSGEGWFLALGVREADRRLGYGRTMAVSALRRSEELGIRSIRLTVDPNNVAAISLYTHIGFKFDQIWDSYFAPNEPRIVMRRDGKQPAALEDRSHRTS